MPPTKEEVTRIAVHAKPRAKKSRVVAVGDVVEIAIAAPPVDGAANDALLRFLAEVLGVPRRCLALARGASSRHKQVEVSGLARDVIDDRLAAAMDPRGS